MQKTSIWVSGASGKLGTVLVQLLKKNQEYKVVGTDTDVDVTDMQAVERATAVYRPHVIINCAGISDPTYCEKNMVEAFRVNALGARNLAAVSRQHNAKIVQLSTDDIFSGKRPERLTEFDLAVPNSVYGKSKYAGENYVRELNPKHLIIRSSWVYGAGEGDYFSYVMEQGKKGDAFQAPLDKISTPTSAIELAKFIDVLLGTNEYGIFHASCEGVCSRHEFARTILTKAGYDPALAQGTFSEENGGGSSTLLENLMMKMTGIYEMPSWQEDLDHYISQMKKEED